MGHDEATIPADETDLSTAGTEPLSTAGASTVDDRNPEGEDETVAVEHVGDIRPPSARENLRLT
jgi:hypothetical protein